MGGSKGFANTYDGSGNLYVNVAAGGIGSNASVGPTGAPVPADATAIGLQDGSGNLQIVSAGNPLPITGSISATNPSVGTRGSPIPASGTFIAGSDGTNLQGLLVESSTHQNLRVSIYAAGSEVTVTGSNALKVDGSAVTQPTEDAADGTPGSPIPSLALQVGGSDGTDLRALLTDNTGQLKVLIENSPAVTISGTVGVTQSTSPWVVSNGGTFAVQAAQSGTWAVTQATAASLNATVVQGTGSNLHTVVDSGTITTVSTVTAVTAISNALPAGTNLLGQVSASNETATVYSGTTALTPLFATVVASASGVTNIIALVTSKRIRVLALQLVATGAVNVKWQSHVTPTDLTGLAYLAANGGYVLPYNPVGWFQTVSGEALDINLSAAVAVGGSITYVTV